MDGGHGCHTYTLGCHMRRASCAEVCICIVEAFEKVPSSCIQNGFKRSLNKEREKYEEKYYDENTFNGEVNIAEYLLDNEHQNIKERYLISYRVYLLILKLTIYKILLIKLNFVYFNVNTQT